MRSFALLLTSVLAVAVSSLACSSSKDKGTAEWDNGNDTGTGASNGTPTTLTSDTSWTSDTTLAANVVIAPDVTVTIAEGAVVKIADGATITVKGTLRSAGGAQAKLTAAGTRWGGVVVASGGKLALSGVDLETADVALDVQGGDASASYDKGTIAKPNVPFRVEAGAKLTSTGATVAASGATSEIFGSFTASRLDYDANGNDGITTKADGAALSIEDSTLHGTGGETDMIVSYDGAGTIHVAYTTIKAVHCAFHLERITNLDVSFVTAQSDSYGFMMNGSLPNGTRTVTSSNLVGNFEWGFHEDDYATNGPVTLTNDFINGNRAGDVHVHTSTIQVTSPATAMIANAQPR